LAVFELSELHVARVNAYRVLYDTGEIAERLTGWQRARRTGPAVSTPTAAPGSPASSSRSSLA
jgi:hypothetical protein